MLGPTRKGDVQALQDELHAALEFLSSPPTEAFADIGGAPQAPDPAQADAAQLWQRKALQLLKQTQELVQALAVKGALPALGSKAVSSQQSNVSAEDFSQVSGASFWRDITSVSSSQKGSQGGMPPSGKGNAASRQAEVPSGAQNGHAAKRSLIEEIDTDQKSQKQSAEPLIKGGLIIEELGDDYSDEHAGEPKKLIQPGTGALLQWKIPFCPARAVHSTLMCARVRRLMADGCR